LEEIYCKKCEINILNTMQKISPENSLPLPKNPKKMKIMISLSYDVNEYAYSKLNVFIFVVIQASKLISVYIHPN